jgi:hypothetical protein
MIKNDHFLHNNNVTFIPNFNYLKYLELIWSSNYILPFLSFDDFWFILNSVLLE